MPFIDFNCDLGENSGNDELIMPYISSANIACGYHAGDEATMKRTMELCVQYNVAAGAHPSYPDKENFGRTNMQLPANEIYSLVLTQIKMLATIAKHYNVRLQHVKPHGALYNMAAKDSVIAEAIAKAIKEYDEQLWYFGLPNSAMQTAAENYQLKFAAEAFADRTYQPDGTLTPRIQAGALIQEESKAIAQVKQLVKSKTVNCISGETILLNAATICIHGDGTHAVAFAKTLHQMLTGEGIIIQSLNQST